MVQLSNEDFLLVLEAIKQALAEVELCADISQGVEDDLRVARDILTEGHDQE